MEKFKKELAEFEEFLSLNPGINCEVKEFTVSPNAKLDGIPSLRDDQHHEFYRNYSHGKLKWKLKDGDEYDLRLTGSINMLSVAKINKDWKGIVYFDSTPDNSRMRLFKPIDLFSDDACAGMYENDTENIMHLYAYEGEPLSLKLSVDNYLLMALNCRGFYFWQYLIQFFIDGNENEIVQDYKSFFKTMKGLYSIDELKERYEQLAQL